MSSSENELELMRRALGLHDHGTPNEASHPPIGTGAQPARHDFDRRNRRFVRDGEVPVVVLGRQRDPVAGPGNRVVQLEASLQAERALRERAERGLHEAQEAVQHLQTKLGHSELAHREALSAERDGREHAERALKEAQAALVARDAQIVALEARLAAQLAATTRSPAPDAKTVEKPARTSAEHEEETQVSRQPKRIAGAVKPGAAKRGRPASRRAQAANPLREDQPVKWWLSSSKSR